MPNPADTVHTNNLTQTTEPVDVALNGNCIDNHNGKDVVSKMSFSDLSGTLPEFAADYDNLKQIAIDVVSGFYSFHSGFTADHKPKAAELEKRFGNKKYLFRYIVRKYFTNASFKIGRIPFSAQLKTARFYLFMRLDGRYKRIINDYRTDLVKRLMHFHASVPEVAIDEEALMQMLKIISACTLSTYIEQPLRYGKARAAELKDAYLQGFYLGISYLLDEYAMDNPQLPLNFKQQFHEEVIQALSNEIQPENEFKNSSISYLKTSAEKDLPFKKYKDKYRILYLLQRAQYDDHCFKFSDFSDKEVIQKIALIGLKTHMSLYAVQLKQGKSVFETAREFLLYSLLVQLDDDMRDYFRDKADNVQTLFTTEWKNTGFNPHTLYLALVEHFCDKNHSLKWLYMDYLSHLKKIENNDSGESLDSKKIRAFIDFLYRFNLKEMGEDVNMN